MSCKTSQLLLADKLGTLPCPLVLPAAWQQLWLQHAGAWAALLRLAACRAARDPLAAEVAWHGLKVARWSLRSVEEEAAAADVDEFMCEACGRWFCSVAAVKLHRVRAHV